MYHWGSPAMQKELDLLTPETKVVVVGTRNKTGDLGYVQDVGFLLCNRQCQGSATEFSSLGLSVNFGHDSERTCQQCSLQPDKKALEEPEILCIYCTVMGL